VARVRLFAAAREAAGTADDVVPGETLDDVLEEAVRRFGGDFARVLPTCKVWINGEEAPRSARVGAQDEVAVLPPVSGGAR
jgi:molybdopterin converting factor small subunit